MKPPKISIRWRKSSATYVIYCGRRVLESGFDSEARAAQYLEDHHGKMLTFHQEYYKDKVK